MKLSQDCFIVRDANGQALAYVYFEEESERRAATRLMTRDEARRIARQKLPEMIRQRRAQALKLVERHFPPGLGLPRRRTPVTVGAYEQCR
jgi:hypothetical protein